MRRAFTLVELLVVLVIVGTVAAVAAPALRFGARGGARDAAERLVALRDRARAVAVGRGVEARLSLDLTTGSYRLVTTPASGSPPDTGRAGALALGGGTRLEGGRDGWALVTFDALGRARGDRVSVVDERGHHDVVTDPWTGATRTRTR